MNAPHIRIEPDEERHLALNYEVWATKLRDDCAGANSEATVAARIEVLLAQLLAHKDVTYEPIREEGVLVASSRKRIDSQFGAVVTEFKKEISTESGWDDATNQLIRYIESKVSEPGLRDEYVGIVTDGKRIRFVLFDRGVPKSERPGMIDGPRLRRWVESLVALERKGLTASNLVDDFSILDPGPAKLGRHLAVAFYKALEEPSQKTSMLRKEWKRLFAVAVDHTDFPTEHFDAYRKALGYYPGIDIDHAHALFALQSAYAVVVKLVALRVLSEMYLRTPGVTFHELAEFDSDRLRVEMERLENGHLLRDLQIDNLLEGDFFFMVH